MMTGEHGSRQIVKVATTSLTAILLPGRLRLIPSLPRQPGGVTMGTTHPLGPPGLAKGLIAFLVIQQVLKGNHSPETFADRGLGVVQCTRKPRSERTVLSSLESILSHPNNVHPSRNQEITMRMYSPQNRNPNNQDNPTDFGGHFSPNGLTDLRFGWADVSGQNWISMS